MRRARGIAFLLAMAACLVVPAAFAEDAAVEVVASEESSDTAVEDEGDDPAAKKDEGDDDHGLALSDEPIPMLLDDELPPRTKPLLELGNPFLGTGAIEKGWELPTGAIWDPSFYVFGRYRTSLNYVSRSGVADDLLENPHRLDLFGNLQLSGTERVLFGVSPLHEEGQFSTYTISPDEQSGWTGHENFEITNIFFEGDFGEIFPKLDPHDRKPYDIGFSIGRQPIDFQDGMMFNDAIDSIGISRNNIFGPAFSNLRTTFIFGWGDIHRNNNVEDPNARVYAILTEADTRLSIIETDLAYVDSDLVGGGDGLYLGIGAVQRIGRWNTTIRVNGSHALDEESAAVSDGVLLFGELSTAPRGTHDVVYMNAFLGIDKYSSAARAPTAGGPLGRTGILFAAVGLGRFPPALGNRADDSFGAAVGYQKFIGPLAKSQLVVELGGRDSTKDGPGAVAVGTRYQRKLGVRYLLQVDGYVSASDGRGPNWGLRTELAVSF